MKKNDPLLKCKARKDIPLKLTVVTAENEGFLQGTYSGGQYTKVLHISQRWNIWVGDWFCICGSVDMFKGLAILFSRIKKLLLDQLCVDKCCKNKMMVHLHK